LRKERERETKYGTYFKLFFIHILYTQNMNKHFYQVLDKAFDTIWIIIYILYFGIAFGLSTQAPKWLAFFDVLIKIFISAFLIIRFNPYNQIKFSPLDQKITFSAGFFVLATTLTNQLISAYTKDIITKTTIKKEEILGRLSNLESSLETQPQPYY
jgi:hypothetical protein